MSETRTVYYWHAEAFDVPAPAEAPVPEDYFYSETRCRINLAVQLLDDAQAYSLHSNSWAVTSTGICTDAVVKVLEGETEVIVPNLNWLSADEDSPVMVRLNLYSARLAGADTREVRGTMVPRPGDRSEATPL